MKFELTILGSNSATPTSERFPSSHVLNIKDKLYMVDCGEGTQIQLRKNKLRFSRLNHVFISHLHGDHCLGLPGMIASFSLLGRKHDLHIYAHPELKVILDPVIRYFSHDLHFPIIYHDIDPSIHQIVYEEDGLEVWSIPLNHKTPTCGFYFKEKPRERKIKKEMIAFYGLSIKQIVEIKGGADYVDEDGNTIANERLTTEAKPAPRSYAYISDTKFKPDIAEWLQDIDLLYHEATYVNEKDLNNSKTYHSSAGQAATLAQMANAKKLLIGHFSARYKSADNHEAAAKEIFENTVAVKDGMKFVVK